MSEDTHIRFLFDAKTVGKRLKWKEVKKMRKFARLRKEGEDIDDEFLDQLQLMACRFMANEGDEYLPQEQAWEIFEELSRDEARDAINKFVEVFQESTIPNASEGQSNSISDPSSPTPPLSPDGSAL